MIQLIFIFYTQNGLMTCIFTFYIAHLVRFLQILSSREKLKHKLGSVCRCIWTNCDTERLSTDIHSSAAISSRVSQRLTARRAPEIILHTCTQDKYMFTFLYFIANSRNKL